LEGEDVKDGAIELGLSTFENGESSRLALAPCHTPITKQPVDMELRLGKLFTLVDTLVVEKVMVKTRCCA
jgi:hypothetical protein